MNYKFELRFHAASITAQLRIVKSSQRNSRAVCILLGEATKYLKRKALPAAYLRK
jgi:hypothetical protein